jgi:hypothetical protein
MRFASRLAPAMAVLLMTPALPAAAQTAPAADTRMAVTVARDEAAFVLGEMRGLLVAVDAVLGGALAGDMKAVAAAARRVGMRDHAAPPASLPPKLPAAFRQMGAETHKAFEQIALDAESLGDREVVLKQLGANLKRCVGCHSAYRFDTTAAR